MNAPSNPFALMGLAGNNAPSSAAQAAGSLAPLSESGEGTFVDSLSAVLAPPLAPPVVPVAEQQAGGFGMFAGAFDNGQTPNNRNLLTGEGASDLSSPSPLLGGEPPIAGNLSRPPADVRDRSAGHELSRLQAIAPEHSVRPDVGSGALEESLLQQAGSRLTQLTSQEPSQGIASVPGDGSAVSDLAALAKITTPLSVAYRPPLAKPDSGQTSTITMSVMAGLRSIDPEAERTPQQLQQVSSDFIARPLAGDAGLDSVLQHERGRPADVPERIVNINHRPSSEQSAKAPAFHPSLVQHVQGDVAANNAQATITKSIGPTTSTPDASGTSTKPPSLAGFLNAHSIDAETIEGVSRSSASAETFLAEPGSLEPVGAPAAKPTTQSAQPPSAQIAIQVARAIPQGIDRFSIQLHPAELGMVEIRLDFTEEGRVSALITAERPETLEMLQRDSRSIERTLNNTGLSLENGGLSFSLKQEQDQHQQGFNDPSRQQSKDFSGSFGRNGGGDDQLKQEPGPVSRHRLLDIRT